MARSRSYYDVLNVAPEAETVVIEAAYRALMKKYHPDQGPSAAGGASATEINEAFALLRDPERRADYDHREWTRQQSVRLAAYPPMRPPPARRSAFGWSGWIVALLLGGIVALMASRADGVSAPLGREAALAAPDFRSQPSVPDIPTVTAAVARLRSEALRPPPAADAEIAAVPSERVAVEAVEAPAAARPAPLPSASAPRRARPRPRARPPAADDKEFLEREGYIY